MEKLATTIFPKNSGKVKHYTGGPTCVFKGKEVPRLMRWIPKGSITLVILIDMLATLELLGVIGWTGGRKTFLILNGHGSRFQIDFLTYVTDPSHKWVICIGIPYGTSLRQVRDSNKQNSTLNMVLTKGEE